MQACKPGSVDLYHLSGTIITDCLYPSTLQHPASSRQALVYVMFQRLGFTEAMHYCKAIFTLDVSLRMLFSVALS